MPGMPPSWKNDASFMELFLPRAAFRKQSHLCAESLLHTISSSFSVFLEWWDPDKVVLTRGHTDRTV